MTTPIITKAVSVLRAGGLVAFPTETVYGLGGDASNPIAIQRIFTAKERPSDHPLIVHIANTRMLSHWAADIPDAAEKLAEAFWPGPLTLILKKQPHVIDKITGGQSTIGVRVPRHPMALALLEAFGGGIAAPSANRFTHISPTTAAAVREELGNKVELILEGGACEVGLESTIVDMTSGQPRILRPGMITAHAISEVLNISVLSTDVLTLIRAPGRHHLHYAPETMAELIASEKILSAVTGLTTKQLPAAVMIHSDINLPIIEGIRWIKMAPDAIHYAHDLYHMLRSLDQQAFKCILIEAVPDEEAWHAIRDRLSKATAPK